MCFVLKHQGHQYREQDGAVLLLSAVVGGAGVTAQPFPCPRRSQGRLAGRLSPGATVSGNFAEGLNHSLAGLVSAAGDVVPGATAAQIKDGIQSIN